MAASQDPVQLPLQICIFVNSWYDVVYVVLMLCLFIWKGVELPYPGSLGGMLAMEVCLVLVLAVLEWCRLFLASQGNKTERRLPLGFSMLLSIPCAFLFGYYVYMQVYVSRLDVILGTIGLSLLGIEFIFSVLLIFSLGKAPPPTQ